VGESVSFSERAAASLSSSITRCADRLAAVEMELSSTEVTARQAGDPRAAAAINGASDAAGSALSGAGSAGVGSRIEALPPFVRRVYAALAVTDGEAATGLGRAAASLRH
jgi:hypothetical protein